MIRSLDDAFRRTGTRFRLHAQSPVLEGFAEPETVWVSSPRGSLGPGPSDLRMYAVQPIGKKPYAATDLPPWQGPREPPVGPGPGGHFDHLSPGDPGFLAAHAFGCVRRVMDVWECYAGGPLAWHFAPTHERLEIVPHVPWDNAHFGWGYMECGEGTDDEGIARPFALNFDVLAHETGHGLAFGLAGIPDPQALTTAFRGFHESASDCVAMLSVLHFGSVLDRVLAETEGNLYAANEMNRIGELSRTRAIRSASNALRMRDVTGAGIPPGQATGKQVHRLSLPLTGAVFDMMVEFFLDRLVAFRLVPRSAAEGLRRAAAASAEDTAGEARCRAAWRAEPQGFRAALAVARDMTGLRLAETWRRLRPNGLEYPHVAATLLSVDREMSGLAHGRIIRDCFAWRGIRADSAVAGNGPCVV